MLIAKYKFNRNVNGNALPTFDSGYEYTVEDIQYDSQYTIRSIHSDTSPTSISFNNSSMRMSCVSVEYLDVSQVTNMRSMFRNCMELTRVDVSNWDTSNVKDMSFMFDGCSRLSQLDTSKWVTKNVVNMSYMFYYCCELIQLDASNWDTSNVRTMTYMFDQCYKLYQLDVSNWDTSNTNTYQMFSNCGQITHMGMVYCNLSTINKLLDTAKTSLPTSRAKKVYVHDVSSSECPKVSGVTFIDYISDSEIITLPRTLLNGDVIFWDDSSRRYTIICSDETIIQTDITSKFKIDLYTPYTTIYADNATTIGVNIKRKEM